MKTQINQIFKALILCIIASSTLTSCSKVISGLYGMKSPKEVDETTILKYGKKYKIPVKDSYRLDTAYSSFLFSFDSAKYKSQIKNHYQPLQALYYDHIGHLKSFQNNCYAGGFPNLKWNRDHIFSTFLPKQQAPVDSIVPLDAQLKFLIPLSKTDKLSPESYDYVVVVYWSKFMGRQSKRLLRIVQQNERLSGEQRVRIVYVNNDNIFIQEDKNQSR